ncbi:MAG TPA: hypothetical protein PK507_03465 [bacterium]|nr:hypothetical protein [bacterium]
MAFLRGDGSATSHLVVDDWDSFYRALRTNVWGSPQTEVTGLIYYYDAENDKWYYELNGDTLPEGVSWIYKKWGNINYIELDPDAENKIIDCNNFSIEEHFLTNNGVSPLPFGDNSHHDYSSVTKRIYGNDWVFKNFWFYGHIFFYNHLGTAIVNKLHFLNCFHLVTDQSSDDSMFGKSKMTFNDCKFSILTTGGNSYSIVENGTTNSSTSYIRMNRCSLNIINTSKEFNFFTNTIGSGATYLFQYPHQFYNCNFRIKALNSGNFLDVEGTGSSNTSCVFPSFYFCKFTCFFDKFRISDSIDTHCGGQRLGGNTTNSSKAKSMLTNCLFQLKFNKLYGGISDDKNSYLTDSTLGIININYIDENKYRIKKDTYYTNFPTVEMSKNDILDLNKITEEGFPVMSKIIPDGNEV